MDLGEKEKFGFESRGVDWNQIGSSPPWIQSSDSHGLSFPAAAASSTVSKPVPSAWNPSDSADKEEVFFSLSHFSSDAGFIERAARFSCFVSDAANSMPEVEMRMNDRDFKDRSDSGSPLKRRRGSDHEMELNQIQDAAKEDVSKRKKKEERSGSTAGAAKPSGKYSKEGEEAGKEDYIHVRARRGQATNSHSLAERVRREKISERMKFLQDLVPGCSKVTGKAVMLDEIINYVQSLQRQVEFLSMKLAAINPRLDFNLEGLLSKDLFQNRSGSSSAVGFSPDMIQHQLHTLHQGLIQVGMPGLMNSSDAFRRSINAQLPSTSAYKDTTHQMPNAWDDDFQNVLHMAYGNNPSLKTEDLNGVPHDNFPL